MNLVQLTEHFDRLGAAGKLQAHEVSKLMAIAAAVRVRQLPDALQRLADAGDSLSRDLPAVAEPKRHLVFMAAALGLAARFEVPAALGLPGYADALIAQLDNLLTGAEPAPAAPTIWGTK